MKEIITRVFHEHGIPLGANVNNIALAVEQPLSAPISGGEWKISQTNEPPLSTKKTIGLSGKFNARGTTTSLSSKEARLLWFTEQKTNWKLPIGETQWIHGVGASGDKVHVLATSPSVLYSLDIKENRLTETQLDRFIDSGYYANQCRLQLATMNDQVMIYDPEVKLSDIVDI